MSWLCEQASQRYYHKCGLLPRLSLQKEGALLSPQDLLLAVLHTNEEVRMAFRTWAVVFLSFREVTVMVLDVLRFWPKCVPGIFLLSLNAIRKPVKVWQWVRIKHRASNRRTLGVYAGTHRLFVSPDENTRVTRLCEVQDRSASVSVCGLCLGPSSLSPLLRALKLQSSLTELRLSGNRLHDELLPELIATTATMPRLQVLDISACRVTAEGLEKAVNAFKGQNQAPFPVKQPAGEPLFKL